VHVSQHACESPETWRQCFACKPVLHHFLCTLEVRARVIVSCVQRVGNQDVEGGFTAQEELNAVVMADVDAMLMTGECEHFKAIVILPILLILPEICTHSSRQNAVSLTDLLM
jgi:hypothetical protein